jgi:predicted nucleotide-binding protein
MPRRLTPEEQRAALSRLEARIKDIESLDTSKMQSAEDDALQTVEGRVKSTLASIFGEDSAEYRRLRPACELDDTSYSISFNGDPTPPHEIQEGLERGKRRALALLRGETDAIRESIEFSAPPPLGTSAAPATPKITSDEIFIVHGHDDLAKSEVAHFIERAGLKATILHQQANGGKTIIEKFEKHGGAAGFAVVLVTPDDVGGVDKDNLKPRARQNVIGEMFWFAGRLGRDHVCALVKGDVEMPSDFAGVVYTPMDTHGGWKAKLLNELKEAGYINLDWQKALA